MNWDPFQREALAELGHRLYFMRGVEAPSGFDPVEPAVPPVRAARPAAPPLPKTVVDPLLRALMRAAGTDGLPRMDLDALRRDPAAKRALWPRLRALRRAARRR